MDVTYGLAAMTDAAVVDRVEGRRRLPVAEARPRCHQPVGAAVQLSTFISLPVCYEDVAIDVAVRTRSFDGSSAPLAGLAYRLSGPDKRLGTVEVRPLIGTPSAPASARTRLAARFFAYPEWPFEQRLTPGLQEAVNGDEWTRASVLVDGTRLVALVDDQVVLVIPVSRAAALRGDIGLFVDAGTDACFSGLRVTPA